eukprot:7130158-Prymnesium_polylepis.1
MRGAVVGRCGAKRRARFCKVEERRALGPWLRDTTAAKGGAGAVQGMVRGWSGDGQGMVKGVA